MGADQIRWGAGGGLAEFFPVAADKHQSNSLNSGTFLDISGAPGDHPPFMETHGNSGRLGRSAYTSNERNNINSLEKKNIYQKFGGPWPPGYATEFEEAIINAP